MICKNCGRDNKEGYLFCEYCGTDLRTLAELQAADKIQYQNNRNNNQNNNQNPFFNYDEYSGNNTEKIKKSNQNNPRKSKQNKKKKGMKAAIILLAASVVFSVAAIVIVFVLMGDKKDTKKKLSYYKNFTVKDVCVNDGSEAYIYNQVLIISADGSDKKDIEKAVKPHKGKIVGYNSTTKTYQVDFSDSDEELSGIMNELEQSDSVAAASYNYVYSSNIYDLSGVSSADNGIGDAKYSEDNVKKIPVAVVGDSSTASTSDICSGIDIRGIDVGASEGGYVSVFEIECEMSNQADEGTRIFEIACDLRPTYDDTNGEAITALNDEISDYVDNLSAQNNKVVFITMDSQDGSGFMVDINDEETLKKVIRVGSDSQNVSSSDICATGQNGQPLEYTVGITAMTWSNDENLCGENVKDIISCSYIETSDASGVGMINAGVSTEVSTRLYEGNHKAVSIDMIQDTADLVREDKYGITIADSSMYLEKLKELGEDLGYCTTGTFGKEYFTQWYDVPGWEDDQGVYYTTYSEYGILSYSIGKYINGQDAMVVFVNKEDGIHALLYFGKSGNVELVGDKLLYTDGPQEYNLNTKDMGSTDGILKFDNFLIGFPSFICEDHEVDISIKEIDSKYYILLYYYRYETIDVREDSHHLVLFEISENGINDHKSVSAWNDCLGTGYLILSMSVDVFDYENNNLDHGETYDSLGDDKNATGKSYDDYDEEEAEAFNADNMTKGVERYNNALDSFGLSDLKYTGSYGTTDWDSDWDQWYDYRPVTPENSLLSIKIEAEYEYGVNIMDVATLTIKDNSEVTDDMASWWRETSSVDDDGEDADSEDESDMENWEISYNEFLEEKRYLTGDGNEPFEDNPDTAQYSMIDFECDGVPELLVSPGYTGGRVPIYGINDNSEVYFIGYANGDMYFKEENPGYIYCYQGKDSSGNNQWSVLGVTDGNLDGAGGETLDPDMDLMIHVEYLSKSQFDSKGWKYFRENYLY